MFRKLVIIGIVIGLAGMAMAAKYIGNPTSTNGWSTTSNVTCTTAGQIGDPNIFRYCSKGDPCSLINGNGLDPTGQKHATEDWYGKSEDSNALWNGSYCLTNNNKTGTAYNFTVAPYDSDMTVAPFLWFAFEFDKTYYIGDMLVWNWSEVPTTVPPPPYDPPDYPYDPPLYRDMYYSSIIVVSYSTDGTNWNEQTRTTLTPGNRMSWSRGDDQQYPDKVPIEGYAKTVVINNIKRTVSPITVRAGLGEVRFERDPNRATVIRPVDGTDVLVNLPHEWTWVAGKGTDIVKHKVYLSTNKTAVDNRTAAGIIQTSTSFNIDGKLQGWHDYYFAIDELNDSNVVVPDGSGKTIRHWVPAAKVEYFDTYTDLYGANPISNTWKDGWSTQYYNSGDEKTHYLNGALVGIDVNYAKNSDRMVLDFDNDGTWNHPDWTPWGPCDNNYSEVTANADNLYIGNDWTIGGSKVIQMYITTDSNYDNLEPIYLILKDHSGHTGSVKYPYQSRLAPTTDNLWIIKLSDYEDQGVDVTDINTVTIRAGDSGGAYGTGNGVYKFELLRLYPARCVGDTGSGKLNSDEKAWFPAGLTDPTVEQGDLNSDCRIDYKDVYIFAYYWLENGGTPTW